MIVELKRTSRSFDECPDSKAYLSTEWVKHRCTCKTLEDVRNHRHAKEWFFRAGTRNHREEDGRTIMEQQDEVWLCELDSLESAVKQWDEIVVRPSDVVGVDYYVEIYDTHRE